MRGTVLAALTAMLLLGAAPAALGEELHGVALVIGESDYDSDKLRDLSNPKNDARAMSELLDRLGFKVRVASNDNREDLTDDIGRFLRDAKKADVALVYYSGHGIEADGADYLVPIDADLSTPQTAGASLVPVQDLLDQLARTVPVTITLLDACRTNAFPSGTTIQLPGTTQTIDVATTGLGEMRGPAPAARPDVSPDNLGMVIGFAAAPGQPALDGEAGGNSPYAAALLKHLGAGGYSFGDVMTLVSEEVYLKTDARQLPWTNSSLRRVLNFGAAPPAVDADEAAIADGRRKLLLSIATTPDAERRQVEAAAAAAKVPMDGLYGLLDVLGQEVPRDPDDLDRLLKTQTGRLKQILEAAPGQVVNDAEVLRLTGLADRAQAEGALALAQDFRARASARAETVNAGLKELQAPDHLKTAATYAEEAQTAELAANYAHAAEMYGKAFDEAEYWDKDVGLEYKGDQATALRDQGDIQGENAALEAAVVAYRDGIALAARTGRDAAWASLENNLGTALGMLGGRQTGVARLEEAVTAFRAALEKLPRDKVPLDWASTQNNIGIALREIGDREGGSTKLHEALLAFRLGLEEATRERAPAQWAELQVNLSNALSSLGKAEDDPGVIEEAIAGYRSALEVITRPQSPLIWGLIEGNLGGALYSLGVDESDTVHLEQAVVAFRLALEERTRARVPLEWAITQNGLATTLEELGERENGTARLKESVVAYRAALEETTRERSPIDWANVKHNLAFALDALGQRTSDIDLFREAVDLYREALTERTRDRLPGAWATTEHELGRSLTQLGQVSGDATLLTQAIEAFRLALTVRTQGEQPFSWASSQNRLGVALEALGELDGDASHIEEAVAVYRAALEVRTREQVPFDWARTQANLGVALKALAGDDSGTMRLEEAVAAFSAALEVWTRDEGQSTWADIEDQLAPALSWLASKETRAKRIAHELAAIEAWTHVTEVYTRAANPALWAERQNSIGYMLVLVGEDENDVGRFEAALPILRAAIEVQQQVYPRGVAFTSDSLCHALLGIGERTGDRKSLVEAQGLCETAIAGERAAGNDDAAAETEANLSRIRAALAKPG